MYLNSPELYVYTLIKSIYHFLLRIVRLNTSMIQEKYIALYRNYLPTNY